MCPAIHLGGPTPDLFRADVWHSEVTAQLLQTESCTDACSDCRSFIAYVNYVSDVGSHSWRLNPSDRYYNLDIKLHQNLECLCTWQTLRKCQSIICTFHMGWPKFLAAKLKVWVLLSELTLDGYVLCRGLGLPNHDHHVWMDQRRLISCIVNLYCDKHHAFHVFSWSSRSQ